jgi:hypothetical protein
VNICRTSFQVQSVWKRHLAYWCSPVLGLWQGEECSYTSEISEQLSVPAFNTAYFYTFCDPLTGLALKTYWYVDMKLSIGEIFSYFQNRYVCDYELYLLVRTTYLLECVYSVVLKKAQKYKNKHKVSITLSVSVPRQKEEQAPTEFIPLRRMFWI